MLDDGGDKLTGGEDAEVAPHLFVHAVLKGCFDLSKALPSTANLTVRTKLFKRKLCQATSPDEHLLVSGG